MRDHSEMCLHIVLYTCLTPTFETTSQAFFGTVAATAVFKSGGAEDLFEYDKRRHRNQTGAAEYKGNLRGGVSRCSPHEKVGTVWLGEPRMIRCSTGRAADFDFST